MDPDTWIVVRLIVPVVGLGEGGAKPASIAGAGMAVDEPAQLGHGPAGILEMLFIELDQSQPNPEVVSAGQRHAAEIIQLERGRLRARE